MRLPLEEFEQPNIAKSFDLSVEGFRYVLDLNFVGTLIIGRADATVITLFSY